jgi:beta-lactamase superfamily II metal-dependent hydrolase
MTYNGFEVFFTCLGNADSILLRHYDQDVKTVVLIDGGNKGQAPHVRSLLRSLGESSIDHLVCSHHHADHAGGLVELVRDLTLSIESAWVHGSESLTESINVSNAYAYKNLLTRLQESKNTLDALVTALNARGIPIYKPFAYSQIGPLVVVSPTKEFYDRQLLLSHKREILESLNARYSSNERPRLPQSFRILTEETDEEDDATALGGEQTSPENELSTVLWLSRHGDDGVPRNLLLTADAGTAALTDLQRRSMAGRDELRNLNWMQLPHHGSRRNLNESLLDYYRPSRAFVSSKGSQKHPSKMLVNAVKARTGQVYSTHYPPVRQEGGWTRQSDGIVPTLPVVTATPLWDAP